MATADNRSAIAKTKSTTGKEPPPSSGIASKPSKPSGKKRKSPSTRKRDHLRLLNWKARRATGQKSQSASPTTKTPDSVDYPAKESETKFVDDLVIIETNFVDNLVNIDHTPVPRDSPPVGTPAFVQLSSPDTAESLEISELTCCPQDREKASQHSSDMAGLPSASHLAHVPDLSECTKHPRDRHIDSGYTKFLEEVSHAREIQNIYLSHYEYALDNVKPCINCLAKETTSGDHKQCSKCKLAKYCSKTCQKEHWKNSHKLICAEYCDSLAQEPISACEQIYMNQKEYIMSLLEANPEHSNMLSNVLNSDQAIHP